MKVNDLAEIAAPELANVLFWDAMEREWRIGHVRPMIEGVEPFYCACSVGEAHDLIAGDLPVPVFTEVTHWARLPDNPGEPA